MQIIDIVLAFFAGMFACCMGSVWVFILCALTSLVGVVSGNPMFVAIAFGPLLNPATTFLAGCVASGYANMRGYGPATVVDMLVKLRKPDVILVGGVAGALGWIVNYLVGLLGVSGLDTVSCAVVIVPLLARVLFEKTPFGVTPDEVKAAGGRRSTYSPICYFPGWRTFGGKVLVGAGYGAVMAAAVYMLVNAGVPLGLATLIGFGFGGSLLLFPGVPGNHCVGCSVCTALSLALPAAELYTAANLPAILIWGVGIGTLSIFFVDLFGDIWTCYGKTNIDAVASSIAACTLITSIFVVSFGLNTVVFPIAVFALCCVWGVLKDAKWKKYAAEHNITAA